MDRFDYVYLLLDALDESPRNRLQEKVLDALEAVRSWGLHSISLSIPLRAKTLQYGIQGLKGILPIIYPAGLLGIEDLGNGCHIGTKFRKH